MDSRPAAKKDDSARIIPYHIPLDHSPR